MEVLDHGYCDYVEHWGSDERIIEAARMSTDGSFRGWDKDERLLQYLWTHKHTSVFEQVGATFEICAPIFVAREVFRHRTFSYNELSARYTKLPNRYYIPSKARLAAGRQSTNNKQASGEVFDSDAVNLIQSAIIDATAQARLTYESLIAMDVAREVARLVIPMNQYTCWRMSGNLRNWLHFLGLRLGPGVQPETYDYAAAAAKYLEQYFPRVMKLFYNDDQPKEP